MLRAFAAVLKVLPLGIYVRAAACKLGFPILMCDGPLCPLAIGQEATDGCSPTGNTAEVKAWCEHGWTPWFNGIMSTAGMPFSATCDEATGHLLLKAVAVLLIVGYTLLWSSPRLGALWLTVFMGFGLHLHIVFLKETPDKLGLQIALLSSSLLVFILESMASAGGGSAPRESKPMSKGKASLKSA